MEERFRWRFRSLITALLLSLLPFIEVPAAFWIFIICGEGIGLKTVDKIIKARLPHPLVQNAIFEACRLSALRDSIDPAPDFKAMRVIFTKKNSDGDIMSITSPRRLKANPDMGVFLAGVALAQKYMNIPDPAAELPLKVNVQFPITEFYNIVAPRPRRAIASKNRLRFDESLNVLAQTSIAVVYGNKGQKKHGGNTGYSMRSSLWDYRFDPSKGRTGGTITLAILSDFIPRDYYLWADAAQCNCFESPVSRQIFWQLVGRQHFRSNVVALADICGLPAESRLDRWYKRNLLPAVDELNSAGYIIKREGEGVGADYVFSRKKK